MTPQVTFTKPAKVLIVDDVHPILFQILRPSDFSIDYVPEASLEDCLLKLRGTQILVVRSKIKVDQKILSLCPELKVIARVGAGLDNIDEQAARNKGVVLVNAPEGNADAVAEHTMGMLLSLMNRMVWADAEVRKGNWPRKDARGTELKGKNLGIIGYGHMGKAFANRLKGFGVNLYVYDKYKTGFGDEFLQEVDLATLQSHCQIISLHIPLTNETMGMINSTFIEDNSYPFYLINTSRGQVVDPEAVKSGIESGKILGMALDVLPDENLAALRPTEQQWFEWLISQEKVVLTPHVAGWTVESYQKLSEVIGQKIVELVLFQ
jgi:D-3-phosphoglycerate dehydrogenase / 2-oxoglutarate reductase